MHPTTELETTVPAFLGKLWRLVEDPETDDLICWAPNGKSFFIRNQAQFARELLPHYYKHNNMASFVRQLNMYGFHKKVSVEVGGLRCERDEMEFAHPCFVRDHPYLLEHIKRKIATTKSSELSHHPLKPEVMNKVLTDVRTMQGRQESLDSRLGAMKRENEALWRELAMLRRKHLKQQEIVNKLIHFLVTLVQPSRSGGIPVKRHYPLMIDHEAHPRRKQAKHSKPETSPTGPVIHELDPSEMDAQHYIVPELLENYTGPSVQSPSPYPDMSLIDEDSLQSNDLIDGIFPIECQLANSQQIVQKRHPKKKSKKVPVKILIPASENKEAREETIMLEVEPEEDTPQPEVLTTDKSPPKKLVPIKTLRSSKLAAMAANINKMNEAEDDSSEDVEDIDPIESDNPDLIKLDDMLTHPDDLTIVSDDRDENVPVRDCSRKSNEPCWADFNGTMNYKKKTNESSAKKRSSHRKKASDENSNATDETSPTENKEIPTGSTSKSKDLSLSCLSPSDAGYREEMGTHLESMQSELDNLRDVLRGEGYTIDANTLLGLFGADDPMSFGIPMNPELDPHTQRDGEDDDRNNEYPGYASSNGGGELMAYNSATNLLDFDDDILFSAAPSEASPSCTTGESNMNNYYTQDSQDVEDSKVALLESLQMENDRQSSP